MKVYAFIPARYQSTRFPGKPLAPIAGHPMIRRVYERTAACKEFERVYVATEDERIRDCVHGFGGQAIMTSADHRSGTDRILEAASTLGLKGEDIVVNIQGDQPIFHPSVVSTLLSPLLADESIPMSTLKHRIPLREDIHNPNHVKVVTDNQGFALYFSRSPIPFCRDGSDPSVYFKHLGFYAFRFAFLKRFTTLPEGVLESVEKLEQLRALEHGFKIKVMETHFNSLEVDVPEDLVAVEEALRRAG
jgi:3-deoxy-manno-octulosonate cytidylyltransferase (CMP-KDO synthetase)